MSRVSQSLDRVRVTFDDDNLVANAGLLLPATLVDRLDLEALIDDTVPLEGRAGGASPGRKVLTLMNTMLAGGSHIDHADMLRAGASESVAHQSLQPSQGDSHRGSGAVSGVEDAGRVRDWREAGSGREVS